jgi:hypothetical protein
MTRFAWAALAAFFICAPAHARDWTADEKAWGTAVLATRLVDWGQTRNIARHPERWRELNPLLPEHPTLGEVNRHFLVSTALMFAAAHYLPQYRKTMLQVWFAVGVGVTARNAAIGIRMEF